MTSFTRRHFLQQVLATGVVYAVGSAFKTLDGSMTAGAKCSWMVVGAAPEYSCGNVYVSPPPPPEPCSGGWSHCEVGSPGIIVDFMCVCD